MENLHIPLIPFPLLWVLCAVVANAHAVIRLQIIFDVIDVLPKSSKGLYTCECVTHILWLCLCSHFGLISVLYRGPSSGQLSSGLLLAQNQLVLLQRKPWLLNTDILTYFPHIHWGLLSTELCKYNQPGAAWMQANICFAANFSSILQKQFRNIHNIPLL